MRSFKKIIFIVILIIGVLGIGLFDHADRSLIYSKHTPEDELKVFRLHKTLEEIKAAYENHYFNPDYSFPRKKVEKVKIYKNIPLISRLTGKEIDKNEILDFVSNPDNFDWSETTWTINESEYIFRFYNHKNVEIGKIWICLNDCGMTESIPFSPTMKFGALSKLGKENISEIIQKVYK